MLPVQGALGLQGWLTEVVIRTVACSGNTAEESALTWAPLKDSPVCAAQPTVTLDSPSGGNVHLSQETESSVDTALGTPPFTS